MFKGCSGLESLDISKFNTAYVTDMTEMFNSISKLRELNLSSFNTKNVAKYTDIFGGNTNLKIIINKSNNPNIISNLPNGVTVSES